MTGVEVGVPLAVVILLLASLAFFVLRKNRKQKWGLAHLQSKRAGDQLPHRPEMDELAELDVTHYELTQSNAPRHELS